MQKQKKKKGNRQRILTPHNEASSLQSGEAALASGQFDQAIGYFTGISKGSSDYGRACKGHGRALLRLQRLPEALAVLQAAHEAFPKDPNILVDAGDAARLLGNASSAEDLYEEARKRGADGFQIRFGEAAICEGRKLWLEAADLWDGLRDSYPDNPRVLHNLGRAWHELGETDRAVSLMSESFEMGGERSTLSMLAMLAPHAGCCDHEDVRRIRTDLGKQLKLEERDPGDSSHRSRQDARINIGYVSAFFHRSNWMKPVWALLNNHDREKFNIHLFADGPPDEINSEGGYAPHSEDSIHDVRELKNRELAQLIGSSDIDVLVDLNGYSAVRRLGLWAEKPAPVTVGWFNQYATSGLPGIEWLIGDDVVIRPEEETFYSEKIVRLKQSYLTFQVGYDTPDIEIPAYGEPFTFGCLGSGYKITPEVRGSWIRLLKETNGSRLIVRNRVMCEESHRKWFLEFFANAGIDPERVIPLGPADHHEFLQTYGRIDLALDTFPYNGGTTTMEALWQGVPLVCFTGDRWVSRTSATLMSSAGLRHFVGESEKEYIDIAKKWSAPEQRDELRKLRTDMRRRLANSAVCDGTGLARDFERIVFDIIGSV